MSSTLYSDYKNIFSLFIASFSVKVVMASAYNYAATLHGLPSLRKLHDNFIESLPIVAKNRTYI